MTGDRPPSPVPAGGPRLSRWAVMGLLCSLGLFCPIATAIGPLLGIRGLVEIRRDPNRRGRRLAIAAIAIGLLATGGWMVGARWWHLSARRPMLEGPRAAIQAGEAGDVAAFKSSFFGGGARAADPEAAEFLAALDRRYGRLLGSDQDRSQPADASGAQAPTRAANRWRPRIRYLLRFESGLVEAEAEFILLADEARGFVFKFGWLVVRDDNLGDLVYPDSARPIAGSRRLPPAEGVDGD